MMQNMPWNKLVWRCAVYKSPDGGLMIKRCDQMRQKADILDRLVEEIAAKADHDPQHSYTASLLAGAPDKPLRKLSEEVTEAILEAMRGDHQKLAQESADILYHLLVVWQAAGVSADEVWQILADREGVSGHVEKANRHNEE